MIDESYGSLGVATTSETSVERELTIAASPETVWQFLVDPELAVRWMGTTASFDPRPGGEYRVEVIPDNTALGEFVEVDPPHRLVFTWGWDTSENSLVSPGSSTIEFELTAEGAGTRLRFRHSGLPNAEEVAKHAHGWEHYLGRLVSSAAGGKVGEDPWLSGDIQ
jgi:uncharacterized protein YndB with AHSA1/START domain